MIRHPNDSQKFRTLEAKFEDAVDNGIFERDEARLLIWAFDQTRIVTVREDDCEAAGRLIRLAESHRPVAGVPPVHEEPDIYDAQVWNTGRQYTPHGQIIACRLMDDQSRRVVFTDISRNIDGAVLLDALPLTVKDLRVEVLTSYDQANYRALVSEEERVAIRNLRFLALCTKEKV